LLSCCITNVNKLHVVPTVFSAKRTDNTHQFLQENSKIFCKWHIPFSHFPFPQNFSHSQTCYCFARAIFESGWYKKATA